MFGNSIIEVFPQLNGELIYIFDNNSAFINIITETGYLHESTDFSYMQNFSLNQDAKVGYTSNSSIIVYHP